MGLWGRVVQAPVVRRAASWRALESCQPESKPCLKKAPTSVFSVEEIIAPGQRMFYHRPMETTAS